ncbi:hypothetical protein VTK73DRAFT_1578 [Phialemonium thermophilum]|uniref:Phosphotransferase n=1 Tax=Phialemonium thermophilum TaxID=223376 RepID=A0ABR3VTE6_9PEZI
MQPLASAMTTLRQVLAAAIKSLLRGKSLIRALLSFWIRETPLKGGKVSSKHAPSRTIDDFLREAEQLFVESTTEAALREFSSKLKVQFREGLWSNPACMLPSFNHQLPHGFERGQYLVLDVGGSTLRVALAELRGRGARGAESEIIRMDVFKINPQIKSLKGMDFFDWVAQRISETLSKSPRQPPPQQQQQQQQSTSDKPLPLGIAWSFPIEQTSIRSGRLHDMGKGFLAAEGLLGQDLGDIIESACQTVGLIVEVSAIVNDSTATLLSQAYINPSTRFGLILGTGVNIAAHLPISVIGREKFGARPDSWYERASHVVVNTELGMFGKGILPATRWDRLLNASHPRPDFQPLEQMVSGYYLGEICRYALIEAINSTGLFGGVLPPSLSKPYSLDTETLSIAEEYVFLSTGFHTLLFVL